MSKLLKQKLMMKKTVSFLCLYSLLNFAFAQNFTYQATIDSVKTNGMYRIELSPVIRQYAKVELSDLRILDSNKTEVPYILSNEPIARAFTAFFEYKILANEIKNNRYTKLIIEKTDKEPISNISLYIANTDITKTCRLSGSNDMKQWYAVSDNQELSSLYDNTRTTIYKSIYFPQVNYRYYQLFINDSNSSPLNISKAGYFKGSSIGGKMLEIIPEKWTTLNDSKAKKTKISVSFNDSQLINRIVFKITEPRYYKRQFRVFVNRKRTYKKRTEEYTETLYESELNSDTPASFDVSNLNEKEFVIEIDNLDNPPLKIASIKFEQLTASIVADFKAGKKYTIAVGNKNLRAPQYDLDFFRDKIPNQLPFAYIGKVEPITKTSIALKPISFWQQRWFMWMCISIGALLIFFFSFNLLKEMQNKKEA